MTPDTVPGRSGRQAAHEQRREYLRGEWGNPLTTYPTGGRILSAMQLPWFTLLPPRGFGVLTTFGRKTGKKRRKCVRAIRNDNRVYLVSLRGPYGAWLQNLRARPQVTLRIPGGWYQGLAREVTDPSERDHAKQVYCETVNGFDRLEHLMHRTGWPTRERIRDLHEHWFRVGTPVVVHLTSRRPAGRP